MDSLLQDQLDIHARLSADELFETVPVLQQRKGVTEADIELALSTLNEKSGKMGALAVVLMPSLDPESPEAPGPRYRIVATVQVIEQPLFNLGDSGTGISAEQLAERVRLLLHHASFGRGSVWTFSGMEPVEQGEGKIAYGVRVSRLYGDSYGDRLATPTLSAAGSTLTITHADPAATLCYTTDGSYPWAGNPSATSASAGAALALAPASSCVVRVAAYRAGYQSSSIATATVTVAAVPPASPG